jgi:hypothetical protein
MTTIRKQANQAKRDIAAADAPFTHATRDEIVRSLKRAGYKALGRGAFAVALAHPDRPDVVIKVGQRNSSKFQHLTDHFPEYVDFLKGTGTRSTFALKVYHMEWISGREGGTYAAVVERCKASKGSKAQKAVTYSSYVVSGSSWNRAVTSSSKPATRFIRRFADLGALDLHSKNVMLRANGQAVITDPLC